MDIKTLENALLPWLCVGTWYTRHPKDDERFHNALSTVFDQLGTEIDAENFEQAIKNVLADRHPGQELSMDQSIDIFVRRADIIASYFADVRSHR